MGVEGMGDHGVFLIGLPFLIAATALAWLGLGVDRGFNRWTYGALGLETPTLVVASFKVTAVGSGLYIGISGGLMTEVLVTGAAWLTGRQSSAGKFWLTIRSTCAS
jgi:hypothetical protein